MILLLLLSQFAFAENYRGEIALDGARKVKLSEPHHGTFCLKTPKEKKTDWMVNGLHVKIEGKFEGEGKERCLVADYINPVISDPVPEARKNVKGPAKR